MRRTSPKIKREPEIQHFEGAWARRAAPNSANRMKSCKIDENWEIAKILPIAGTPR
jgi:hypothetical protein